MSEIYFGDCFENMRKIQDKSITFVCLDLPYGQTACAWDVKIDLERMWIEFERICKITCIYALFCSTKFGYELIKSKEKWFRYDLVYHKVNKQGFLNSNRQPLREHEMIYIFKNPKGTNPIYNNINITGELIKPYKRKDRIEKNSIYAIANIVRTFTPYYEGKTKCNTSIIKTIGIASNNSLHQTQKPLDILENLIKNYSNEGDTVLDITAGCGSVGHACINTNRKYICIEKDWTYYTIMYKRLFIESIRKDLLKLQKNLE